MDKGEEEIKPHIGVFDGVSIIAGIVIGVGIFKAPLMVYSNVSSPWVGLAVWFLGGVLAFIGALCFAELASAYPRSGGDYVYLTRAFGPFTGFMFGWAQITVLFTGSIGVMAFVFADYFIQLFHPGNGNGDINVVQSHELWGTTLAILSTALLTILHIAGLILGKAVQNILTSFKVVGLTLIVLVGVLWGNGLEAATAVGESTPPQTSIGFALIMVLYAFGGWNDAALISSEVKDPSRTIVRILLLGTGGVCAIYLLINLGYIWGLGFENLRTSATPATDLVRMVAGNHAGQLMAILVSISALGAMHGLIYTGSRIYAVLGEDFKVFRFLSYRHTKAQTPLWALGALGGGTIFLTVVVGTQAGRLVMDRMSKLISGATIPWETYGGRFETLVSGTAPVFWFFFLLTGISVFVLRHKEPETPRPFRIPLYPVTPFVFCATSGYMLYSSIQWAKWLTLLGVLPLFAGVLGYAVLMKRKEPA